MPVEKITVSLPAGLVSEIDRLSDAEGVSRSSIVREATALYVSDRQAAREAAARRAATAEVLAVLDDLRARVPHDDRPVLEVLREARGELDEDSGR